MTDRIYALLVTLEDVKRDDDMKATIAAIAQMRGVIAVDGLVADSAYWSAQVKAKHELATAIHEILTKHKES